ncbi:MAG TPA: FAD-dependent oxidoreductase [Candidatus Dormibacteraeota bacterium]|nr:FAD-dependent oxidoreductase [Candidatus Dormibacteraeota bacterium]
MVAGDKSDPADVLILGGGPAGYVCAIRAAQNARSVTLVERARVGGVCLNEGCIPSKHLALFAAEGASKDLAAFQKSKKAAIDKLVGGVSSLLKAAGVTVIAGTAWFVGQTRVCVEVGEESVRYFDFKDVVIATGSRPKTLDGVALDGERVVAPSAALDWTSIPETLAVVGDDYVAVELAVAFARLGSRVTLTTASERLLPDFDTDLSAAADRGARSVGVEVSVGAQPAPLVEDADRVIVAGARVPNVEALHVEAAGIAIGPGGFAVDRQLRIDRHVFAIGDVTEGLSLAHRATMQARVAGDVLGGKPAALDITALPRVVYAEPELATVGATDGDSATLPLAALGRAVIEGATAGFVKLVFDKGSGIVRGAHIAGPRATDLIGEMTLAVEMGATLDDIALTAHAHPTFAEGALEAAELALGRPIHVRAPRK